MTSLRLHLQTYRINSPLLSKGPVINDNDAIFLIRRRSTPAHSRRSLDGQRSVSAPRCSNFSPGGLETRSFFMTASDPPSATHATSKTDHFLSMTARRVGSSSV